MRAGAGRFVPPFKGNDTGGIIAYPLARQTDIRTLAINHCARYGKVVKFLAVEPHYGGYISFACRWVPYGAAQQHRSGPRTDGLMRPISIGSTKERGSMTLQLVIVLLCGSACWLAVAGAERARR